MIGKKKKKSASVLCGTFYTLQKAWEPIIMDLEVSSSSSMDNWKSQEQHGWWAPEAPCGREINQGSLGRRMYPFHILSFKDSGAFTGCGCVVMEKPLSLQHTPGKNCSSQKKSFFSLVLFPDPEQSQCYRLANHRMLDRPVVPPHLQPTNTFHCLTSHGRSPCCLYGKVKENAIWTTVNKVLHCSNTTIHLRPDIQGPLPKQLAESKIWQVSRPNFS